jgi:hypothetical protein
MHTHFSDKNKYLFNLQADCPRNIGSELVLHQFLLGLKYWEEPLTQGELSTIVPADHDPLFSENNYKHNIKCFPVYSKFLTS